MKPPDRVLNEWIISTESSHRQTEAIVSMAPFPWFVHTQESSNVQKESVRFCYLPRWTARRISTCRNSDWTISWFTQWRTFRHLVWIWIWVIMRCLHSSRGAARALLHLWDHPQATLFTVHFKGVTFEQQKDSYLLQQHRYSSSCLHSHQTVFQSNPVCHCWVFFAVTIQTTRRSDESVSARIHSVVNQFGYDCPRYRHS